MGTSTKVKVKTSKANKNYFPLTKSHGTTSKFYEPNVPYFQEVVGDTDLTIKTSIMRRVDPMPLPPMNIVKFNTRFFYVPFIDICPYYNNFITNTPYNFRYGLNVNDNVAKIPTKVPMIRMSSFIDLFFYGLDIIYSENYTGELHVLNDYMACVYQRVNDSVEYGDPDAAKDFVVKTSKTITVEGQSVTNENISYFSLTSRGRQYYKIIKQLGYELNITDITYTSPANDRLYGTWSCTNDIEFSALPLLAFIKVYLSYYENSAFYDNTSRLKEMESLLHTDVDAYYLNRTQLDISADLGLYMTYERDYFTTSFVNPVAGNVFNVNGSSFSIKDTSLPNDSNAKIVTNASNSLGTPTFATSNGNASISALGIKLLQKLSNFMKAHQIAGGRMVDRMLVEYGISVEDGYSKRTSYIDGIRSVMAIQPVLNTTSEQLGDYAGFGQSSVDGDNNEPINIHCEYPGYIIAIDTISPEIFYYQGYNKHTRRITKFDFLTPKFDAVGTEGIEVGELLCSHQNIYKFVSNTSPSNLRFGNKPRSAAYKEMYNVLTGDFIVPSVNIEIDGYFSKREFNIENWLDNNQKIAISQSQNFSAAYDNMQYARMFYYNQRNTDYIKSIFRFEIDMYAPMQELYEEYKLSDEYGNDEVTTEVGGQTFD